VRSRKLVLEDEGTIETSLVSLNLQAIPAVKFYEKFPFLIGLVANVYPKATFAWISIPLAVNQDLLAFRIVLQIKHGTPLNPLYHKGI
jgi:hypothetical protein